MSSGYLCCFSNNSMPGILNISVTTMEPDERAAELFTTEVPLPFTLEIAKKVVDPKGKKVILYERLEKYAARIHPLRDFFRISKEDVYRFFAAIDGDLWIKPMAVAVDESADDPVIVDFESTLCKWSVHSPRHLYHYR